MRDMQKNWKNIVIQVSFILAVLIAWQISATNLDETKQLLFPTLNKIGEAMIKSFTDDQYNMLRMVGNSMLMILEGLGIGIAAAFVLSGLSMVSKTFYSIYNMVISVFDLLPGVALLPLAILWFGIGKNTIIFLVIHSVVWPMSRSVIDGFRSTPKMYLEAGRNIGLNRVTLVTGVYIPAAFNHLLSGIKVGWARAWRGLLSAEMIFGATSSSGAGIGFFIQYKRSMSDYASLFASLIVIIIIGVIVEYGIFYWIEKYTVKKWGMTQ